MFVKYRNCEVIGQCENKENLTNATKLWEAFVCESAIVMSLCTLLLQEAQSYGLGS